MQKIISIFIGCIFAQNDNVKRSVLILLLFILFSGVISHDAVAQCSICTKTAQQMGEGPARGLNAGILYLAFAPLLIIAYLGFRWWKNNKAG
jgi:hypothetical protein